MPELTSTDPVAFFSTIGSVGLGIVVLVAALDFSLGIFERIRRDRRLASPRRHIVTQDEEFERLVARMLRPIEDFLVEYDRVDNRAYGKRDEFRFKLASILVSLRARLRAKRDDPAWDAAWIRFTSQLEDLMSRIKMFVAHSVNAEPADRDSVIDALIARTEAFFDGFRSAEASSHPRLNNEIIRRITGGVASDAPLLEPDLDQRVKALCSSLDAAIEQTRHRDAADEIAFTLRETRRRYLVDSVLYYERAYAVDPQLARDVFTRSLVLMEDAVKAIAASISDDQATPLIMNARFLEDRLGDFRDSAHLRSGGAPALG